MGQDIEPLNSQSIFKDITEFTKQIEPVEVKRKNCKFCCSEHRLAAEAEYARMSGHNGSVVAILRFLQNRGETTLTYATVKNHLVYHLGRKEVSERLKEHGEEMARWRTVRPTKERRLEDFIDILYRRIYILEAHSDTSDGKEKIKTSETVARLIEQVNKCQIELDKSQKQTIMVRNFIDKFTGIVELHMKNSPSREATQVLAQALVSILEEAQKIVGEMSEND